MQFYTAKYIQVMIVKVIIFQSRLWKLTKTKAMPKLQYDTPKGTKLQRGIQKLSYK